MADPTDDTLRELAALRSKGLTPKAIAKKLALRPAQVSEIIRRQAESRAVDQPEADRRPVAACLVSPGWASGLVLDDHARSWPGVVENAFDGARGLAVVLVAIEHRYDKVLAATFMLDLYCLGAKTVVPPRALDRIELSDFVRKAFRPFGEPLQALVELAQNLVLGAVDYARQLGFEPDPDYEKARPLLGEWPGPSHIQFGREGKPLFVNGPDDDVMRIVSTLNRTVGEGNYDVIIGGPPT